MDSLFLCDADRLLLGLTVIAGHLLLQSPEEDAFWTFVSLMDTHIRSYFSASPAQMEVDATLFGKAVESNDAALAKKVFVDMDIPPASLCRPWYVSPCSSFDVLLMYCRFSALFLEALPLEHSQRVWDIFLFEGTFASCLVSTSTSDLILLFRRTIPLSRGPRYYLSMQKPSYADV